MCTTPRDMGAKIHVLSDADLHRRTSCRQPQTLFTTTRFVFQSSIPNAEPLHANRCTTPCDDIPPHENPRVSRLPAHSKSARRRHDSVAKSTHRKGAQPHTHFPALPSTFYNTSNLIHPLQNLQRTHTSRRSKHSRSTCHSGIRTRICPNCLSQRLAHRHFFRRTGLKHEFTLALPLK